jgi:hypothetical protein
MTVESTTQALCDLALRFGEGDEESMVIVVYLLIIFYTSSQFFIYDILFMANSQATAVFIHYDVPLLGKDVKNPFSFYWQSCVIIFMYLSFKFNCDAHPLYVYHIGKYINCSLLLNTRNV